MWVLVAAMMLCGAPNAIASPWWLDGGRGQAPPLRRKEAASQMPAAEASPWWLDGGRGQAPPLRRREAAGQMPAAEASPRWLDGGRGQAPPLRRREAASQVAGAEASPRLLRFLALGDSYTIGEGVGSAERWPDRLVVLLGERGVALAPPEVIARTGWTSARLRSEVAEASLHGRFDLVSLMIGVNDQFAGVPVSTYEGDFAELLARAVALAGGDPHRVLVLSIPDYGVTRFARRLGLDGAEVAAELARFDAVARAATERAGARWVDITPLSRRAAEDPGLLAADGLHPSARLHAEWAELVLPAALAALRDR